MLFKEELSWILDKKGASFSEENERENIEFIHSLGEKCDSVGWSELDLNSDKASDILLKIEEYCKKEGKTARGIYTRTLVEKEPLWYELTANEINASALDGGCETIKCKNGKTISLDRIKAFRMSPSPVQEFRDFYVNDKIRKRLTAEEIKDISFCWTRDTGKYSATQFFALFPHRYVSRVMRDYDYSYNGKRKRIAETAAQLGGRLPDVVRVFHNLKIYLTTGYFSEELPENGFSGVYMPETSDIYGIRKILIHRDTAKILLGEKLISKSNLTPVIVSEKAVDGYKVCNTEEYPIPEEEEIKRLDSEYEKLMNSDRPKRKIKEKDALNLFRLKKKECPEDYSKAMTKRDSETLLKTSYEVLSPFYRISDGGVLSDEYTLLSYRDSLKETEIFIEEMKSEELSDIRGIVFALCPDGDRVILKENGMLQRINHEDLSVYEEKEGIISFIYEALSE